MSMSPEERQRFLAEPRPAVLAVSSTIGQPPLQTPVWYHYEVGDEYLWIATPTKSLKASFIRQHRCFSLCVQQYDSSAVRYVTVNGKLRAEKHCSREELRVLTARYLPAETVEDYVESDLRSHGPYSVFRMSCDHWLGLDVGAGA